MKEMTEKGVKEDVGSLKEGVPMSTPYNPGNDNSSFLPVAGGANKGKHPAKQQGENIRYMTRE
jgi:hypothetical protein